MCVTGLCVFTSVLCAEGRGDWEERGGRGCLKHVQIIYYIKRHLVLNHQAYAQYQITKTNFKRKRLILRQNICFHIRHILTYRPHTITINKHVSAPSPCKHALPCNQQVFGGWLFGKVLPTSNRPLLLHKKVKGTVQSRSQPSHNHLLIQNLYCLRTT